MSKLTATLWLHKDKCRVIVRTVTDTSTEILYVDDTWNNRASAELSVMVNGSVLQENLEFVKWTEEERIELLDKEFEDYIQKIQGTA